MAKFGASGAPELGPEIQHSYGFPCTPSSNSAIDYLEFTEFLNFDNEDNNAELRCDSNQGTILAMEEPKRQLGRVPGRVCGPMKSPSIGIRTFDPRHLRHHDPQRGQRRQRCLVGSGKRSDGVDTHF